MNPMSDQVGLDCTFELDEFSKPKVCSESETIKNALMFILFSKPGQYPSIPFLGLNIQEMLYSYYDEFTETELEEKLITQCNALGPYFQSGDVAVKKMMYRNMPSLIIHVSTTMGDVSVAKHVENYRNDRNLEFFIGLSVTELNELLFNINSRYVTS